MEQAWSELREFIRRLNIAEADLKQARFDAKAAAIGLAGVQAQPARGFSNCSFTGQVGSCTASTGYPNAYVNVAAAGSSMTVIADSAGNFHGGMLIPNGGTTGTFTTSPPPGDTFASRYASSGVTTHTLNRGSNLIPCAGPVPASGYDCIGLVYYPVTKPCVLDDSFYGMGNSFTRFFSQWQGSYSVPGAPFPTTIVWLLSIGSPHALTVQRQTNVGGVALCHQCGLPLTSLTVSPFRAVYSWTTANTSSCTGGADTSDQVYLGNNATVTLHE